MQVDSRVAIEVERIQLYGKKLNLLVVKTTLVLMLLAMSFLASGSDVHAANGNFVWAKSMGGASTDQGLDIAVDGSGSVYTTGAFQGTMDFDPGPGTFNLTSNGNEDVFVSKLDSNGDFVWAKTIGGAGTDQGLGIAVDGSGNVHTTGLFDGTMDFDPGPGAYNLIGSGVSDIFVSKLDSNGDFVWAKSMGGRRSTGRGIAVDGEGNVHVTGFFIGTGDFDPGPGTFNLTGSEVSDVFISKLDSNGNFVWAKSMAGRNVARGYGIAVDGSGNVHTVGRFVRTVDFEPGSSAFVIKSSGDRDIFVSKLDNNGNFVWAKSMGGTNMARGNGITVDGSGNVYTVGRFEGMVDFDPGSGSFNLTSSDGSDVFVSKLGIDGNFVWAKSMGGTIDRLGYGIAIDGGGNVHITGSFIGTADFDPGTGAFNLTSSGGSDVFIAELDSNGDFVWAKRMGGTGNDQVSGIAVDNAGNVYTSGSFRDTVDFDPGIGAFNLTSSGNDDVFVSKLGHPTSDDETASIPGDDSGLSVGAIIGFSAAAAIVAAFVGSGIWYIRRRRGGEEA